MLNPVAAHWVAIADQLEIAEVDIIKQTPGYTVESGLRDLLHRWLHREYPPPTLEDLCQALKADDAITGGATLAKNLEEKASQSTGNLYVVQLCQKNAESVHV